MKNNNIFPHAIPISQFLVQKVKVQVHTGRSNFRTTSPPASAMSYYLSFAFVHLYVTACLPAGHLKTVSTNLVDFVERQHMWLTTVDYILAVIGTTLRIQECKECLPLRDKWGNSGNFPDNSTNSYDIFEERSNPLAKTHSILVLIHPGILNEIFTTSG